MLSASSYDSDQSEAPGFVTGLRRYGDAVALIGPAGVVTYADLEARVDQVARQLAGNCRLALVVGANTVDTIAAYLGALRASNPVLLVSGAAAADLISQYDPDIVVGDLNGTLRMEARRGASIHTLHSDLALLLSTSGSTGSAKLVRLSRQNLQANAESVAEYLGITGTDRAATTLPMYYCYGLSVIHSHLLRGASLILTGHSVADTEFWTLMREHGGTSFAGVPHTFELLDRVGFEAMRLPRLRYITQAGGRLAPERVRHYAALGRRHGWQLVVMYGQTEATARMAYLPPAVAEAHPDCVGIPIPGGSFRLEPIPDTPDQDAGELIYSGPNVMLGYAMRPDDLRLGRTVEELRTGDIARLTTDGLYQIVGRRSRFLKLLGLRVDLQRVEEMIGKLGLTAHCVGDDDELIVVVVDDELLSPDVDKIRRAVAVECGLPQWIVRVVIVAEVPRLMNGKVNYQALRTQVPAMLPAPRRSTDDAQSAALTGPEPGIAEVAAIYAEVLGRTDVTDESTFVGLGGDSLSYVEASVRLEQALGTLPANWHTTPVRELRAARKHEGRVGRVLETGVALRAVAIVLIAGTHGYLFQIQGAAHALLALVGYNFGRFQVTAAERGTRAGRIAASIGRIAIPTMAWCAISWAAGGTFFWANIIFVDLFVNPRPELSWLLWFIDTVLYTMLAMLVLLSTGWGDRLARRFPFGLPLGLIGAGLVLRYDLVPYVDLSSHSVDSPNTLVVCFWLFAIGWAVAKTTTSWQRLLLTAITVATVPGFFRDYQREAIVVAGVVLLIWVPTVLSTTMINRVAGAVAAASLYIYLIHFSVIYRTNLLLLAISPKLAPVAPALSVVVGIAAGIVVMHMVKWMEAQLVALWQGRSRSRPRHSSDSPTI